jgi:transposase
VAVELGPDDLAAGRARRLRSKRQLGELIGESPHVELVGRERIVRCARRCVATAHAARRVPLVNVNSPVYHPTATSCLDRS